MIPALPWTGERYVPQILGDIASEHLHRYAAASKLAEGKTVVDIACGEGYGSNLLASVARAVIGIDVDEAAVAHARQAYPAENLSFLVGTCDQIPLPPRSVDLVVSFETLEHHDRHLEMMVEVRRILRDGGMLLISTPDKEVYSDLPAYSNPYHVRELYRPEFEQLLRAFFNNVAIYGQRMYSGSVIAPLDGSPHSFISLSGRPGRVQGDHGLTSARYLIGLAWNGNHEHSLATGIFESDGIQTDGELREASLTLEVQRLSRELNAKQGNGCLPHSSYLPASASKNAAALERLATEHAEVIEKMATRIDDPDGGDPSARIAALQDDVWYWRERRRFRNAAEAAIPSGAIVAVVSRGDDRLLELGDRSAVHFPRGDDGSYRGRHPDDDDDAMALLEQARERGAEYLLIPGYDLWLLDDYPGFGRYVRENYREVKTDSPACVIFALR